MARQDGRVEKGQSIRSAFSAKAWNRAQEAADIVLGVQTGIQVGAPAANGQSYTWIYVKNENSNGQAIPRWGTVVFGEWSYQSSLAVPTDGIDGPATRMFEDSPVLVGRTPGRGPASADAFGIAVEPIAHSAVGRVAVSGVVQCRIRPNAEEIGYAPYAVPDFATGWLKTSMFGDIYGGASIMHIDLQPQQDGFSWALVRLDSPQPIRRGIITSTWINGTTKPIVYDAGPAGPVTLANGERRQDGGSTVYQGEFEAVNFLATLQVPVTSTVNGTASTISQRWVYCAKIGREWHLIAYEKIRTSGESIKDSGGATVFI